MLGFIDSDASFLYLESALSNSLHFSFQVFQERVEALQRQLHAVEKKLMSRELEYQEQVKLQTAWTSVHATSPGGPGRSHVSSLSHWYALHTFYTFHEIQLQEPEPWARNAVPISEGFLNNNRPLWPWVKEKREREIISWLIAPGGSLDLLCVCRNVLFVLETSGDLYWAPQTVVGMCPGLKYLFNHRRALLRNSCTELALYSVEEPQRCLLSDWVPVD